MAMIKREVYYFENPGEENTEFVIEAVKKYIEKNGPMDIVVASTSGSTALKLAKALNKKTRIICVSEGAYRKEWGFGYPCMDSKIKKELEEIGVIVLDKISYILHGSLYELSNYSFPTPETIFKDTLYTFGQGMKVAVEVVIIATEFGLIEPFKYVIGIGGSGRGADTAAVLRSTYSGTVFSKDKNKRLEIREIIAMPLNKKWWD
ncbi:MAG: pyruvate kinase alpha/beta domain-containing protein [Candidatus Methanomethylicaceae archaeon]|nr:pyruvate kinase alpha/beta domain-containing protein [Candidatus Verstraetearchaeota archaeon]